MIRPWLALLVTLFAANAGAAGQSDGSLARSAAHPFRTLRHAPGEPWLRVERLKAGSAAARAGLEDGDLIVAVDGVGYDSPAKGRRLLEHGRGGQDITLTVRRAGEARRVRYRAPPAPLEDIPDIESRYGSFTSTDGFRLRTITTRPSGARGPLPALYFVQSLSCDSIEYPLNPDDHGWQTMIQQLAGRSGVVMMRTEKAGIGDSEGDCAELDYETELDHHRQALRRLTADPGVDPARLVIFGASMGGNMAALLAAESKPAGLVIWGTAIKTWFEHLVEFNRRNLELSGRPPAEIADVVNRQIRFLDAFLLKRQSPAEIATADPALGAVWQEIRGSSGDTLYGRPYRYHQQAHARNWLGAIGSVRSPTLVLYGEFDWFESLDDHVLIARVVERSLPGGSKLVVVPAMDHHFSIYPSQAAAFRVEGGYVAPQRPVMEIVAWLSGVVGAR